MRDDALDRLLGYHGLRFWLANNWHVRFRVWLVEVTETRPFGIRYSFTLHDDCNVRLLGYDNAHGVPKQVAHDHRHAYRHTKQVSRYAFKDADQLLIDFMTAVEAACAQDGIEFVFVETDVDPYADADEGDEDEDQPNG